MWVRPGILLLSVLTVMGCTTAPVSHDPVTTEQGVRERAGLVLQALHASDGKRLADLTHPRKGVRFSPYAFVRMGKNGDLVFTPAQLRRDYLTAPQVGYNQILKQGNTRVNIHKAYPEGVFMEFHLPGSGEHADFTWSGVRLVFEREKGT